MRDWWDMDGERREANDPDGLHRAPQVSAYTCIGCEGDLFQVGSFYACSDERCDRFAIPVDAQGRTDEEALAHAVKPLAGEV